MYLFDFKNCELVDKITLDTFIIDKENSKLLEKYLGEKKILPNEEEHLKQNFSEAGIDLKNITLWDKSSFSPQTPIIHIIKNCDSACIMCDCWKTKELTYHSKANLEKLFKSLSDRGATSIMVTGGEPTLHPELEEIIDLIHQNNMSVQLNSNGISLNTKKFLYKKNIDALIISMDGLNEKDYKSVRGVDKFKMVCENIKAFQENSPETIMGLRVTLTKYLFENFENLLKLCKRLNIDHVGFSPLDVSSESFSRKMSVERSKTLTNSLLPDIKFIEKMIEDFRNPKSEVSIMINDAYQNNLFTWTTENFIECLEHYKQIINGEQEEDKSLCKFPYFSLVLDYDGSIRSCFYSDSYSTIESFENDMWDIKTIEKDLLASGKCAGCRGKIFCG